MEGNDELVAAVRRPHAIRRLYDWVLHWAETPYGVPALFLLAFAESSFFPVPPDVLLIALALSMPARAWRYAAVATAGSVIGGFLGYAIGAGLWAATRDFFIPYLFSQESFDHVVRLYEQYDFWVVFTAAFTPIPYKVITITAGVCSINLPMFIVASAVGRGARFFLVGALINLFGTRIRNFIERYFNLVTVVFTILLVGGFIAARYWRVISSWFG